MECAKPYNSNAARAQITFLHETEPGMKVFNPKVLISTSVLAFIDPLYTFGANKFHNWFTPLFLIDKRLANKKHMSL